MVAYLEKAKDLMKAIYMVSIEVVPRSKNVNADTLAKLASTKDAELLDVVSVEFLTEHIMKQWPKVMELELKPSWIDPIDADLRMVSYMRIRRKPEFYG